MEILVVVGILSIVTSMVTYSLASGRKNQILKSGTGNIVRQIVDARERTLRAKDDKSYAVHLESDRAVLFSGAVYSASDTSNEAYLIDTALEIVNISLNGGGSDAKFERLSGKSNQYGAMELRFKTNTNLKKTINISKSGLVTAS